VTEPDTDSLRLLPPARPRGAPTTLELDGELHRAYEGEPVAAALFAEGVRLLARSPKYHRPRGLFCASGHCGSCFLRIDGKPNVRACMTPVVPGMRCERQNAFPDAEIDVLAAADWLFPGGMDHHKLMTGSRLGNELFVKFVRQMGGSGTLPDQPAPAGMRTRHEEVDVAVVGAGPAGLTAARVVAEQRPGARVLVLDDQLMPGGSLLAEPDGWQRGQALAAEARRVGARVLAGAEAIGVYRGGPAEGDGGPAVLAVATAEGLLAVRARRFLYATGAYDQGMPMPDGDRPGVLAARAVGRLAFVWGIAPRRLVLVTTDEQPAPEWLASLCAGLEARGVTVERASPDALPKVDLRRDVLALGSMPAPASELPRQHGARVTLELARGGFCVQAEPSGACGPGALFVAGDVTGYEGPARAAAAGARVGAAVAAGL
jgi:sarcosine oxidase subunit alpha